MQSNETERETQNNDPAKEIVLIMRKHGLRLSPGNGEDGPGDMYTAAREILALQHRKTLEARLDELSKIRFYRTDDGSNERAVYERTKELQSQLPKKERTE